MRGKSIGSLRHRLILERVVRTADGGGGASEAWVEEAVLWGAIRPLSGTETMEAARLAGRHSFEIRTRYRAGVEPAMRFRLGARLFHIVSVENMDERGAWLTLMCEEREFVEICVSKECFASVANCVLTAC